MFIDNYVHHLYIMFSTKYILILNVQSKILNYSKLNHMKVGTLSNKLYTYAYFENVTAPPMKGGGMEEYGMPMGLLNDFFFSPPPPPLVWRANSFLALKPSLYSGYVCNVHFQDCELNVAACHMRLKKWQPAIDICNKATFTYLVYSWFQGF